VKAWASWKLAVIRSRFVRLRTPVENCKVARELREEFQLSVREKL